MTLAPNDQASPSVDELCNSYVDRLCEHDPFFATGIGAREYNDRVPDYSPAGIQAQAALTREFRDAICGARARTAADTITQLAFDERSTAMLDLVDAGQVHGALNVIASPIQELRDIVDLMPQDTADAWENIATRLRQYDVAIMGYMESLRHAISAGNPPARRQVEAVAEQVQVLSTPHSGPLAGLLAAARVDGRTVPAPLHNSLTEGLQVAATAFSTLHSMLTSEVLPAARVEDAVGEDVYRLYSRMFLGADIDLRETYEWGLQELADIESEMSDIAHTITPGGSLDDAIEALNNDPSRIINDAEAFREWMQAIADEAVVSLAGVHFDIPEEIRTIECRLAPAGTGGIYYTGPSEDFTRPGRMWWSVPADQTTFSTWAERTTVYHEGVPGHHLQIGQTMVRSETLNRWRRNCAWTSGHGEGWALYAEKLMADLGFLDDPADRLGMLCAQAMRAMRVAGDIGLHCGYDTPAELGGGRWNSDSLAEWIRRHGRLPAGQARFEHLRYMGWPGQAPSYKVGERLWLNLREQVRTARGKSFDIRQFHRQALDLGSLGLGIMPRALELMAGE